ncbi:hypothetical protein IT072_19815 [Leifsonia sp. ZF2019]|uniref:hypothetical protein n=1 Tax=Leifsonia sp. ZF2019 TaxID=2781978 RepID=UPI001CC07AC5|nr:hypothetical protein [Leifsonia sp. ZF2019]UAJ79405.1 hypothetical protein IT072_19815 [Leifsonia sp. ZF2019]
MSISFTFVSAVAGHLIAMIPSLGLTEPLFSGFYLAFLIAWTIPAALAAGAILGFYGWVVPATALRSHRTGAIAETLIVAGYAVVAGGCFAVVFGRLWTTAVWWGTAYGAAVGALAGILIVRGVFARARWESSRDGRAAVVDEPAERRGEIDVAS